MNLKDEKIKISLRIFNNMLPLKMWINRSEEETFRKMAVKINDEINQYQQRYKGIDKQVSTYLIALEYATKYALLQQKIENSTMQQDIDDMQSKIRDFLNQQ